MFHTGKFNKITLKKRKTVTLDSDNVPKLPRLEVSRDYTARTEDVYNVPEKLLCLSIPPKKVISGSLSYSRKKRNEKIMKSYTTLRKAREEFREKLLKLIIQDDGPDDKSEIPSRSEKQLIRYYYYLKFGIDTVHIAPLDHKIVVRVHNLIATKLKKWNIILMNVTEDMKEDFITSMKKAVVDFVLRDPRMIQSYTSNLKLKTQDIAQYERFVKAKIFLHRNLNSINSCIAQVLDIWWNQYQLINMNSILAVEEAYTIEEFHSTCTNHIENAVNILKNQWIPLIKDIFVQGSKRKLTPPITLLKKCKRFYNCLSCIMTYNLQTLCLISINEYTSYLLNVKDSKGFKINVVFTNETIVFEPSFKDIRSVLLNIYSYLINACKCISRIETQLYDVFSEEFLKPVIDMDYVEDCKKKVNDLLDDQRICPELRIQDFDDYIALINGEIRDEVNVFLKSNPPKDFEEFCNSAKKFVEMALDIPMNLQRIVAVGMYEIDRGNLIDALQKAASYFANAILGRMTTDYQAMIKEYGEEYQGISDTLLKTPASTAALMDLNKYCEKVENELLIELETKLRHVMEYITFLSDYTTFTPLEMKSNNNTFQWYAKMPSVLEESRKMCNEKTLEFQEALQTRIGKFHNDLGVMLKQVDELQFWGDIDQLMKYVVRAAALHDKLGAALLKIGQFNEEERSFGWEESKYPLRKQINDKLTPYKKLYDSANEYLKKNNLWMTSKVGSFEPETIESDVNYYCKTILKLEKIFSEVPETSRLVADIKVKIEEFQEHIPTVQTLGNPGMKIRHWEKVSEIVGFPIKIDESLTLEKIIDYGLNEYIAKFEIISQAATKENILEKNLDKMMFEWEDLQFTVSCYRETGTYVLGTIDEIQLLLDDHIVKTQTMKNSPYIKPFEATIIAWEAKLQLLQEIIDEWLHLQATWMYFEPIFSTPDIQQQMAEEARKFSAVDKIWRETMKAVNAEPRVLDVIEIEKMLEKLKKCNSLLEIIQNGLYVYLEKKRICFPRFYFLSNEELLAILCETKDPTRVQPHLKKCFEGIEKLVFNDDLFITDILSAHGEKITLHNNISTTEAKGQVEKWLQELEQAMKISVGSELTQAIEELGKTDKEKWLTKFANQCILCADIIVWTTDVVCAITNDKKTLEVCLEKYLSQISSIQKILLQPMKECHRLTLISLLTQSIHLKDVISDLIFERVESAADFAWLSQLRFYWNPDVELKDKVQITLFDCTLKYDYEYLGNAGKLITTPITSKAYRCIFNILNNYRGCSIEGPAGCGKTETVKELARTIAKKCVIFNCSQGLDYLAMGKFFKGLLGCGAWTCFDEFNRINADVLSIVAQQIITVQRGLIHNLSKINFEGVELPLNNSCAIFITLTPEYIGRFELPNNLKYLFQRISMTSPDYYMISEIELFIAGYANAKALATKIVSVHHLCYERLSEQSHYDFGLRAIKYVLKAAKELKTSNKDDDEESLVLKAFTNMNRPKIMKEDLIIFDDILKNVFRTNSLSDTSFVELSECLHQACESMNIQPTSYTIGKAIQIYEMISLKNGVVLLGDAFSGKTVAYKLLSEALKLANKKGLMSENQVQSIVINPKSMALDQLYGYFKPLTHEWCDGILAITFRNFANSTNSLRKWIVLDGPIDTIWIENLNTVLDDNKKICLMSGEIIALPSSISLLFETFSLEMASPATISRCGVIYFDSESLGWEPLVESWLNTLPTYLQPGNKQVLKKLFTRFCPPLIWLLKSGDVKEMYKTTPANLIQSAINIIEAMISDYSDEKYVLSLSDLDIRAQLEGVFFFSIIWSLGATLEASSRPKFDMIFKGLLEKEFPEELSEKFKYPYSISKPEKNYIYVPPKDGLVYDYRYLKEGKGKWKPWNDDVVIAPPISRDTAAHNIIVTTVDTVRYTALLKLLVYNKKRILLIGPSGTGKTFYITDFMLNKLDPKIHKPLNIAFSAATTANQTQDIIMSKLDKRKKGVYGPPIGIQCVIYIDDISLPRFDEYGAQPAIEILRQAIDQEILYNRKDNAKMNLIDIQFLCSMVRLAPGAQKVSSRFLRHFGVLCIDEFDHSTLTLIFSKIMLWHLDTRGFSKEFDPCINELVLATLDIYKKCRATLLPTPSKPHYLFNLRDCSRVIQGVLLSVPEVIEALQAMKRLWIHECLRVFSDRLVSSEDKDWFVETLRAVTTQYLNENFEVLLERLNEEEEKLISGQDLRKLIYCDFANPKADTRHYSEVFDLDGLSKTVDLLLFEFNNMTKKPINLVLFRYAVEHVSRICRVIGQPRAHLLLIGLPGSGKQSLTKLAAHINDYELFQIEIGRTYGFNEWREDMKNLIKNASTPDHNVIFLFPETQMVNEAFLDDVNNLLNFGEIQNLYNAEERADMIERMRLIDKQRDKTVQTDGSIGAITELFTTLVREQTHVVITISPNSTSMRNLLRKYPSFVNCCTIDLFEEWPDDALLAVANTFMKELDITEPQKLSIIEISKTIHEDVKKVSREFFIRLNRTHYVTSLNYLEMFSQFKTLVKARKTNALENEKRYKVGLKQLTMAASSLDVLQTTLDEIQPKLQSCIEEIVELSAKIDSEKEKVVTIENEVLSDQEQADEQAKAVQKIKDLCDSEMEDVINQMNAARTSLSSLTPADITFIKSMKSPPKAVKIVMEAVCLLKESKSPNPTGSATVEDYWSTSKKNLADPKFIEGLLSLDKETLQPQIVKRIQTTLMEDELFVPEKMKQVAVAAEALCKWVIAIISYDSVAKTIAPKKQALAEAQTTYNKFMGELNLKQTYLKELRDSLEKLEEMLIEKKDTQKQLETDGELCTLKLVRAELLIKSFGNEKDKWSQAAEDELESIKYLIGNMLVSSAAIAYLGPYTKEFRQPLIKKWCDEVTNKEILISSDFSLKNILIDSVIVQRWKIDCLPEDDFSIESAVIIKYGRRWPLIIDSQGQANQWIKNIEKEFHLNIIRLSQPDFLRVLENAIQFGQPVLLENVGETIDELLDTLLLQQTFKQGNGLCLKLGENIIEYHKSFRFYMTTRLKNPNYKGDLAIKVNIVNFEVVEEGLSKQLLSVVVGLDRPELQQAYIDLNIQAADNSKLLQSLTNNILVTLSTSEKLLEDEQSIQTLNTSNISANEIKEKQVASLETRMQTDEARQDFKPIATYAANLFILINELSKINEMYQYSLDWFKSIYSSTIDNTDRIDDINLRLRDLKEQFTYSLYTNICQGLYEKDKLLFSFLLAVKIMQTEGKILIQDLMHLLKNEDEDTTDCPVNFIAKNIWNKLIKLDELESFNGILENIKNNSDQWKNYLNNISTQQFDLPVEWNERLNNFQKLLVVKTLREDLFVSSVEQFVKDLLGSKYIQSPMFQLRTAYLDSKAHLPILFLLSPNSDPMEDFYNFAEEQGVDDSKIYSFSMGQGQGLMAQKIIEEVSSSGCWVMLQNCHMAPNWLHTLEKITEDLHSETTHPDFRLWLTSEVSDRIPASVLQNCVSVIKQAPQNLRENIAYSYTRQPIMDKKWFENNINQDLFKKFVYSLCFFHAVVNERKSFGCCGWTYPYDFNDEDLALSLRKLKPCFNKDEDIPLKNLIYQIGDCNYGSKTINKFDYACLKLILTNIVNTNILNKPASTSYGCMGAYLMPEVLERNDVLNFLQNLPSETSECVFGLNNPVKVLRQSKNTEEFTDKAMLIQDRKDLFEMELLNPTNFVTNEENVLRLVESVLSEMINIQVPRFYDSEDETLKSPLNVVLRQECVLYENLYNLIRDCLEAVVDAVKGKIILTERIEDILNSIAAGEIPKYWLTKSYQSLKSFSEYMGDFFARVKFISEWYNDRSLNTFWISGFYNPRSFLASIKQICSERLNIPISDLEFYTNVQNDEISDVSTDEGSCYINRLFLDGASWDENKSVLREANISPRYNTLPKMYLTAKLKGEQDTSSSYECPVYRTSQRTGVVSTTGHSSNYLTSVWLPSDKDPSHWILRGTAIILQLP